MEEEEFIIAEQRHREILSELRKLTNAILSKSEDSDSSSEIKEEIISLRKSIDAFSSSIKAQNLMTIKKSEWTFKVSRNDNGQITSIDAKQK